MTRRQLHVAVSALLALAAWTAAPRVEACARFWQPFKPNGTIDSMDGCKGVGIPLKVGSEKYPGFSCATPTDAAKCDESCHKAYKAADCEDGLGDGLLFDKDPTPLVADDECKLGLDNCNKRATCQDDVHGKLGNYTCTCPKGYNTKNLGRGSDGCSDSNECVERAEPCGFGPGNPTCKNFTGGYACPCTAPYFGDALTGCSKHNACAGDPPCSPLSTCRPEAGDPGYSCRGCEGNVDCGACPPGFKGDGLGPDGCLDVNECAAAPGPCDPLTKCVDHEGGFSCGDCPAGYTGDGVKGCEPTPACQGVSCAEHAHCEPSAVVGEPGDCACNPGFAKSSKGACVDVDECDDAAACPLGTECENAVGFYQCLCPNGQVTGADGACGEVPGSSASGGDSATTGGAGAGDSAVPGNGGATPTPAVGGMGSAAQANDSSGCSTAPHGSRSGAGLLFALFAAIYCVRRGTGRAARRALWSMALGFVLLEAVGCSSNHVVNQAQPSDGGDGGGGAATQPKPGAGGAGTHPKPQPKPGEPECRHSRDCDLDAWCNPGTGSCESRRHAGAASWGEVVTLIGGGACPACHAKKQSGAVDATKSGQLALFNASERELYDTLVAGGISCGQKPHRLCVDDPASSLLAQKLRENPSLPAEEQPSAIWTSWLDSDAQAVLRWIAQGAARELAPAECGNFVLDDGEQCDLGSAPPTECAYGLGTCTLCSSSCKKVKGTGPQCGDGTLDAPYEDCDSLEAVVGGPRGGVICLDCRQLPKDLCGGAGLACCASSEPCEAGSFCDDEGTCQACGDDDQVCCPGKACGEGFVCRNQGRPGEDKEELCRPACGEQDEACCTFRSEDSQPWCDEFQICDSTEGSPGKCVACGGHDPYAPWPGERCCPAGDDLPHYCSDQPGNYGYICNYEDSCEPCGEIGQRCCGGSCPFPGMCDGVMCIPHPCGGLYEMCCGGAGGSCDYALTCDGIGSCVPCGDPGQSCCQEAYPLPGQEPSCTASECDSNTNLCRTCGYPGNPCCDLAEASKECFSDLTSCNEGYCQNNGAF